MSYDQSYPFPQVFLVDSSGGPQHSVQTPHLIPCWSSPPAQGRVRSRGKDQGCMGIRYGLLTVLLFLLLLVFAALGLGAHQIYKLHIEVAKIKQKIHEENEFNEGMSVPRDSPEKQIGFQRSEMDEEKKDSRHAAHVIGPTQDVHRNGLRWEPRAGRAFTEGEVVYRAEDGSLQVNHTGLYHIYSRVELHLKECSASNPIFHSVYVRRVGHHAPLTLMEGNRVSPCITRKGQVWTSDSYLGSALQLHKQDRVYVNVSHPGYLSHEHYANFFGLYKI
ncbi:tumor necrosis factor ligand superfamily member 6 [Lampris incognitus]|uniref:tumor necrosis factor ligand superfamily member 6 n=1 Tax=Lampris incognitus TaxID=2546036 RepID=UPI0024B4AB0E|nr:tumor necrosis factor ligand superfamily member 6 [Lampris incognitus]